MSHKIKFVNMSIFHKLIYRFNRIDRLILKVIRKCKGSNIAKTTLKKNKAGGQISYFRTYYKATLCGIGIKAGK